MPRIPVAVQQGNFGTQNAGARATGRSVPRALVKMPAGVAQSRQRFSGLQGIDPALARMLDQMQGDIATAQRLVKAVPFLDGNLVQGTTFTHNVAALVPHGLGRAWRGVWMMLPPGVAAGPFFTQAQAQAALEVRQIAIMNSGATCTCDCWVW